MVMEMQASMLSLQTAHFGEIAVDTDEVIHLLAPLPPFFAQRHYVLLSKPEEAPFVWFQSTEEPALALILAPYEELGSGAPPALSAALREELGLGADDEPEVYAVISLTAENQATANMLAPIYLCPATRRGRQVITDADLDLARVPLF